MIPPKASPVRSSDAGPWASQFAQVLTETLAGSRPPGQIVPWTTEQTRRRISQLGPLLASAQRPRVRRVIVTSPASDVLEMAIVAGFGPRVRALAVRLERTQALQPGHAQRPSQPPQNDHSSAPATGLTNRTRRQDRPGRWYCTAVEAA
jgi:hypothetical protein